MHIPPCSVAPTPLLLSSAKRQLLFEAAYADYYCHRCTKFLSFCILLWNDSISFSHWHVALAKQLWIFLSLQKVSKQGIKYINLNVLEIVYLCHIM